MVKARVWEGPSGKGWNGGVSFSMLSRFLVCRERFRVHYVEGLRPIRRFDHKIEYGNMWHVCEEALSFCYPFGVSNSLVAPHRVEWEMPLAEYVRDLAVKYPHDQDAIAHWYNVCLAQFPVYVDYWRNHPDMLNRTPLLAEQVFDVPYKLPSGRIVRLRGKWDGVDLVTDDDGPGIWLSEHKTKGDIEPAQMRRQLKFDLQTMLYIVALQAEQSTGTSLQAYTPNGERFCDLQIKGVRYNVVRRPLSGGIGSIVQNKNETKQQFYARLKGYIDGTGLDGKGRPTPGPSHYFMRWNVDVSAEDIERFKRTCLDPLLEQLCHWYAVVVEKYKNEPFENYAASFRYPFGVYNALIEGNETELDNYLDTGSTFGLERVEELFEELKT